MSHTWIHNPDTDGYWHCPDGLVDGYVEGGGWELCDPPAEHNPAVAEGAAWRAARAAEAAEAAAAEKAAARKSTTKAAAGGESKEG